MLDPNGALLNRRTRNGFGELSERRPSADYHVAQKGNEGSGGVVFADFLKLVSHVTTENYTKLASQIS